MKRLFSISRKQAPIIITLLIVILSGASYLFIYIPNREGDLIKEHFRWLQQIDDNIQAKIDGSDTLLNHLLNAYLDTANTNSTKKYIETVSKKSNFKLFVSIDTPDSKKDTIGSEAIYPIKVSSLTRTFKITARKKKGDSIANVSIEYDFKDFVQPLPKNVFDQYVIFCNKEVVYEDFRSGLGYKIEDSLLKIDNRLTGASVIDEKIGGEDYKIFLQPVSFQKYKLIIAALHSTKKYNAEKRHLPWQFVLSLLILAIGLLLFIPLIKISFVGKDDRLRLFDAIEMVIVLKLLMSLLFFCFFRLYNNSGGAWTESKQILAQKIGSSFTNEVANTNKYLNSFDTLIRDDSILRQDIKNLGEPQVSLAKQDTQHALTDKLKDTLNSLSSHFLTPELNWLDQKGFVKYNWFYSDFNNPHANYRDRNYFKNVKQNKTYVLNKDTFFLAQVVSRTSGLFRTIMSKHSSLDSTFIVLSFDMKSVDSVIMPAGYSFAIIRDDGAVLYHSDKTHNLNENLVKEFSDSSELKNALQGRYREQFATNYYGKEYKVCVLPIRGFPYFVAVMEDTAYSSSPDIETNSFTAGMVAFFMLFVLADIVFVILLSSRRSYFKNRGIVKTWLWPRRSSNAEYVTTTIAHLIMIILLVFGYFLGSDFEYFIMLLVSIPITSFFINALFASKYEMNKTYRCYKFQVEIGLGIVLLIMNILIIHLIIIGVYCWSVLIFELAAFMIFKALLFYRASVKKIISTAKNSFIKKRLGFLNISFVSGYGSMIFTRMIITSGIPVVFFYTSSFNFEQNVLARYREYDFANKMKEKFPQMDAQKVLNIPLKNAVYIDSAWLTGYCIEDSAKIAGLTKDHLSLQDSSTSKMYNLFGLYDQNLIADNDNFYLSQSYDSIYRYNNIFKDVLKNKNGSETYMQLKSGNYLRVGSKNFAYVFPSFYTFIGWSFWFLLILVLTAFYFVLLFIIQKMFAIKVPDISSSVGLDKTILESIFTQEQDSGIIFLITLDFNKKSLPSPSRFYEADLSRIPDFTDPKNNRLKGAQLDDKTYLVQIQDSDQTFQKTEWEKIKKQAFNKENEFIILNHFDYKISNLNVNNTKLEFLKQLVILKKKIIIVSTVHPLLFLNSFFERSNDYQSDEYKKQSNAKAEDYISTWNRLLGNAPIIFFPLSRDFNVSESQYITAQIRYSNFLQKLSQPISSIKNMPGKIDSNELEKDIFSIRLQTTAYNFYTRLWHSLTKEEKFILYDLAEDGLINTYDRFSLNVLISKGLIIRKDGLLHVFNKSFRNFVLTGIGETEIFSIKKQCRENSSWNTLRTPLVLVIVAILVFIFGSQEGIFTKTVGYITLLTGSIPALIQLLSLFNRADTRPNHIG
ncbi:MAG: hypothetical protein JWR05_784 [Mucilaginibacter sp.]|nr:hypothetical protein [Mucilaginibacter sp.]